MSTLLHSSRLICDFLNSKSCKPLVVILGPTGSGKTDLAIKLAKKFNGEIISADSRMIYRKLDIGTAKPTLIERQGVPHYLIDVADPSETFTLANYKRVALKSIREIHDRGKVPFLVGGTGLYIDAVAQNFTIPRVLPNLKLRLQLEEEIKQKGENFLYNRLKKLDPKSALKIDPRNHRYLIRALEIALSGKKKSDSRGKQLFDVLFLGLDVPREKLYLALNQRAIEQFEKGVIEETQQALDFGISKKSPALSGFVYREIVDFLEGKYSHEEALRLVQQKNRNYAKRQMTWFRRNKEIIWLKVN